MSPNDANSPVGPARRHGGGSPGRPRPGLFRTRRVSTREIGLVPDRSADDPVGADKSPIHPFGVEGQGQTPISIYRDHPASATELSHRVDHGTTGLLQRLTTMA